LSSTIHNFHPAAAIEGGRISIHGSDFPVHDPLLPEVRIGEIPARIVYASSTRLDVLVPSGLENGPMPIRVAGVSGVTAFVTIAVPVAQGLHQVDNPVFDRDDNLYVTYSGTRGQHVPVSIFCVRPNGTRETFSSGIVNPTSMAIDPEGRLYVSSRFEGTVYRIKSDGTPEPFATDLGVACGLAFAPDGMLFVGDRSGTIFRVDRDGHAATLATLPASVAAFHLALSPEGTLYVTGPTLASYDALYRVTPDGDVSVAYDRFGRPQGIAFDTSGRLHVVDALAGTSGVFRMVPGGDPELVLAGPALIGLAFSPAGSLVVTSNDTAYRVR